MKKLLWLLLLLSPALAQNTVTVTAANIQNGSSGLLTAGTVLFQSVNSAGQIVSYQIGGTGPSFSAPIICTIASGAITGGCTLPNVLTTNPPNLCFQTTIKDVSNVVVLGGPGSPYSCVQPTIYSSWCSAGVCDFDNYSPTTPNNVYVLQIPPPNNNFLGGIYSGVCNPGLVISGYNTQGIAQCVQGGGGGGGGNFSVNGVPLSATNVINFISSSPTNGQTFTFTNPINTGNIQLGVSGGLTVPGGGTGVTNITGVLKGGGTSPFTTAVASDIVGLFGGCSGILLLGADGTCHSGTGVPLGTAGQLPIVNAGATAYAPQTPSGDLSMTSLGVFTVTKTNGNPFGAFATQATPCTVSQGCTGTTGTLSGLVRGGTTFTASELSGQVTTSGSNVASVVGLDFSGANFTFGTAPSSGTPCFGWVSSGVLGALACGSGGGTVPQFSIAYGGASSLQGLSAPTGPTGLVQSVGYSPSGGANNPQLFLPGLAGRAVITSTDTVVATDCNPVRIQSTFGGVVTETIPTATSLGDPNCAFEIVIPANSGTTQMNFSSPWTINGATASAFNVFTGQAARFQPNPSSGSDWQADKVTLVGAPTVIYRSCTIVLGADNGIALVNADLNQKHQCFFPKPSTIVEIDVEANAAASTSPTALSVNDYSGGTTTNLFGSTTTLPVVASTGGVVCARATTSASCFVGTSSSTVSLTTTAVSGGDWIDLTNGAADGVTARESVVVTYTTP